MTKLTKLVRREVPSRRSGNLVATVANEGVYVRRARSYEGERIVRRRKNGTEYTTVLGFLVEWGLVYQIGAKLFAGKVRAERRANRGRGR